MVCASAATLWQDNVGAMAEENTDKINSAASKKRKRHVLTRLHVSVLFTHPTPVSLCLAQRGSDNRGSTVWPQISFSVATKFR